MRPNLRVPLAIPYDQRGEAGYTRAQAGYDQRKVNAYYEFAQNAITGAESLILSKRPGVTLDGGATFGVNTQVPYLCIPDNAGGAYPTLFVKDGNITKSVTSGSSVTILNNANYAPNFVSKTNLSGTTTYVAQLRLSTPAGNAQRMFYSSTLASWTEIVDAVFAAIAHCGKVIHMNGRMFVLGPTGIWGSDLNTVATWSASNFAPKSIEQDFSMGLMAFNGRVMALGEETCEFFYYGDTSFGSQLLPMPNSFQRVGLGRMAYIDNSRIDYSVVLGDRLYFIGRFSKSNSNSLIAFDGARFEKVSGNYEQKLINFDRAYGLQVVTFFGRNAVAIMSTPPGTSPAKWLMFFPDTKAWFEWESTVFCPINSGNWFAGVANPESLFYYPSELYQDNGGNYQFLTQFRPQFADDEWKTMPECGVIGDNFTGSLNVALNTAGEATFTPVGAIDMSQRRKAIPGCGGFNDCLVQLEYTGDQPVRLRQFYATVT